MKSWWQSWSIKLCFGPKFQGHTASSFMASSSESPPGRPWEVGSSGNAGFSQQFNLREYASLMDGAAAAPKAAAAKAAPKASSSPLSSIRFYASFFKIGFQNLLSRSFSVRCAKPTHAKPWPPAALWPGKLVGGNRRQEGQKGRQKRKEEKEVFQWRRSGSFGKRRQKRRWKWWGFQRWWWWVRRTEEEAEETESQIKNQGFQARRRSLRRRGKRKEARRMRIRGLWKQQWLQWMLQRHGPKRKQK